MCALQSVPAPGGRAFQVKPSLLLNCETRWFRHCYHCSVSAASHGTTAGRAIHCGQSETLWAERSRRLCFQLSRALRTHLLWELGRAGLPLPLPLRGPVTHVGTAVFSLLDVCALGSRGGHHKTHQPLC